MNYKNTPASGYSSVYSKIKELLQIDQPKKHNSCLFKKTHSSTPTHSMGVLPAMLGLLTSTECGVQVGFQHQNYPQPKHMDF